MSYLVLARKYRPQNFSDLIGQEHVSTILKKAVESNRIAHAYLLSGPRGVGKTSCARILAKCLNCEKGPTLKPCDKCTSCKEITAGTSFDVLEIDGASNRGIDEVRALRENVKFAPSYGRYKIYIVDEVHMLTMEAFNALLKTLEEPPEHVLFIFATTAPQKIPSTIISRCQRFDFKRIPISIIEKSLNAIAKKEKFKIEQDAVYAVAKAAKGSMRDALSILDQMSALRDQSIKANDVHSMLGLVETELLLELSEAIGVNNCLQALKTLEKIIDQGKDLKQLTRDIVEHFRHLMIIKVGGKSLGKLVDYPIAIKERLLTQCDTYGLSKILLAIETFIEAQEISRTTESLRMPLEVAFAKLTFDPQSSDQSQRKTNVRFSEGNLKQSPDSSRPVEKPRLSKTDILKSRKGEVNISGNNEEDILNDENKDEELEVSEELPLLDVDKIKQSWDALTYAVSRKKMSVATYLQDGIPVSLKSSQLIVGFQKSAAFHKEALEGKENTSLVQDIFSEKLKTKIYVKYVIVEEYQPTEEEPIVTTAIDTFQGKVVSRWHKE